MQGCGFALSVPQSMIAQWFLQLSDLLEGVMLSLKTKGLSAEETARHIREVYDLPISDEYVRVNVNDLMLKTNRPLPLQEPSGVVVHDEQFVKMKGVALKRISTVDANNANVYYDELHSDRTADTTMTICNRIKNIVKNIRAVVMDGLTSSQQAYAETFVGILIQYCLFHFAKNIRDAYKEEVGYGLGRSSIPIEHLIGFFSIMNIFFDHEREIIHLRQLQKELDEQTQRINRASYSLAKKQEYIDDIKKNYDHKAAKYLHKIKNARRRKNGIELTLRTEEQATQLLEKAKLENVFPKKVQKQVDRLERDWTNFTHCLRDNTIPPTSNKVEQYYSITLNWLEKNNLQSKEQFYQKQKFFLIKRYNIPLFEPGQFTKFLHTTFTLLLTFGT